MNKVLIWDNFKLNNIGGASGYLYNIHEYLKNNPSSQITFLSDVIRKKNEMEVEEGNKLTIGKTFRSKIPSWLKFWRLVLPIYYWLFFNNRLVNIYNMVWKAYYKPCEDNAYGVNLNEYDFIHFHLTPELYRFKRSHPEFKGKLILTSHCPCLYVDELAETFDPWIKYFRSIGVYNECKAFKAADYLMFPCREAREPYEKDPKIRVLFQSFESKFFYVPTSLLDFNVHKQNIQKFSDLGIPEWSFVITYFGRHVSVKGYDILKEVGETLLEKYQNLYFLCAGKGNIPPLNHPRWIELGFINNALELLQQSDLYILPNRDTYFDIITLEILRSGTNLILSNTGGNKYFRRFPEEEIVGLHYFDINNFEQLIQLVDVAINEYKTAKDKYIQRGEKNRLLYEHYFKIDMYIHTYAESISHLL